MRTVGEILKQERIRKNLSLEEIEKLTKIRLRYLQLLEENDFAKIPQGTVCRGFIRNYAQVLDLSPEGILAIFRRDFIEDEKGQIVARSFSAPLTKFKFSWQPRMTIILLSGLGIGLFLFFLLRQYLNFVGSPRVVLERPAEGEIFRQKEILFAGKTDPDASLYINSEIVNLSSSGEFQKIISLTEGENEFILEAINRRGKKTRLVRRVNLQL